MAAIYTKEWYEAMVAFANGQKDLAKKVPGGEWRFAVELAGDGLSPYVPEGTTKHFFIKFLDGKVAECRESEGPIPGKQLNYRISGPAHVFEGVAAGIVDPVEAGLGGALSIRGDMRVLMQNADMANVIFEIYKQSGLTEWPKGKPPYTAR